ncbi:hypothetical protein Btru_042477 [Bulinus truncatus]|nr:hypothetical protein Btru_042477 [Bulinus truncatus]
MTCIKRIKKKYTTLFLVTSKALNLAKDGVKLLGDLKREIVVSPINKRDELQLARQGSLYRSLTEVSSFDKALLIKQQHRIPMSFNMTNQIIEPYVYEFLLTFNLAISAELIGLLGILGNVINILNFAKQGLKDTVNVTLTTLAVSDIGSLLLKLLIHILVSPFWSDGGLPFSSSAITLMFFFPQGYFLRVSGYITAYAAFERSLCVLLPLKVKTIISRKVAVAANCGICIVLLAYLFPVYYASYVDFRYFPRTNRSLLTICYRSNAAFVYKVNYFFNDLALPYISFLILILCTAFIITSLKSKAKWRNSVTASRISKPISKRDGKSQSNRKSMCRFHKRLMSCFILNG